MGWAGLLILVILVGFSCRLLPNAGNIDSQTGYDPALLTETLSFEGVDREVLFYVPYPLPDEGVPVVFMLHGGGGTAERAMETTTERRWNELAFKEKFIVVYPTGWNRHWNDCRADIENHMTDRDDVEFMLYLLEWLGGNYPIDTSQIFAAGHSNGGMMAMRLGLEAPEVFAAVFSNNGPLAAESECSTPEISVPVMFLAGTADPLIPYEGGYVGLGGEQLGAILSAEDTVSTWLTINDIVSSPVVKDLPDKSPEDGSTVTRLIYKGEAASVWFYRVNGGGHAWPGEESFSLLEQQTNGNKNHDVNAADLAWEFFQNSVK